MYVFEKFTINNKHIPKNRIFSGDLIHYLKLTLTEIFYLIFSNPFN